MSHDEDAVCRCVAEHRPPVLEYAYHHILPKSLGGPDDPDNLVALCPTAHANVHELLRLMCRSGRLLTDHQMQTLEERPVSRYAGTVAREGFRRLVAATGETHG